jgi:hypothetical protein
MTVLVRVDVATDDTVPVPLDGVLVRVYNNSDVFVTEGTTGTPFAAGRVEFTLTGAPGAGAQFRFRLSRPGWSIQGGATREWWEWLSLRSRPTTSRTQHSMVPQLRWCSWLSRLTMYRPKI